MIDTLQGREREVGIWVLYGTLVRLHSGLLVQRLALRRVAARSQIPGSAEHAFDTVLFQDLAPGDSRPVQFWHRDTAVAGTTATSAALLRFQ